MSTYGDRVKQYKPKSGDSAVDLLFRILQANDAVASVAPSGPGATEAKQDAIITALGSLALELTVDQINLNTDTLETSNDAIQANTNKSNFSKITEQADDKVETYTFYDSGTADERPNTIVYSSVALGLSVTETYVWLGTAPNYYLSTITYS